MFLNQATKAPVCIEAGDYRLGFKKFRLKDWGQMTAEFVAQKEADLTRGMAPDIAYRYKTFSPVIPPTLMDIKEWSRSAPGVAKIIQMSLTNGRCMILAKRRAGAEPGGPDEWEEFTPPLQPNFNSPGTAAKKNGQAPQGDPDAAAIRKLIEDADDDDLSALAFNISDIYNRRAQLNEQSELEGQETFGEAKEKEEIQNPLT